MLDSHSHFSISSNFSVDQTKRLYKKEATMFEESVSSLPSIWASMNSWFTPAVFFVVLNLMIGIIVISSRLGYQKPHRQSEAEAQEHPRQLARPQSVLQKLKSFHFQAYRSQEPATNFDKSPESETHFAFKQLHERDQPQQLPRSQSILQRLNSINLYSYQTHEPSTPESSTTAITATAITSTSDLQKTQEFDTHFMTPKHPPENEEEEDEEEEKEEEDEDEQSQEDEYEGQDQYADQKMNEIYGRLQRTHATNLASNEEVPTDQPTRKMKKSASAKVKFEHPKMEDDIVEARRQASMRERKIGKLTEDDQEVDARANVFINMFNNQLKLQRQNSIIRINKEDHDRRQSGK